MFQIVYSTFILVPHFNEITEPQRSKILLFSEGAT